MAGRQEVETGGWESLNAGLWGLMGASFFSFSSVCEASGLTNDCNFDQGKTDWLGSGQTDFWILN